MGLLFLFIDGVGLGPAGPENPLSVHGRTILARHGTDVAAGDRLPDLPDGWTGIAIDATLGVDGLPQSATGQTSLLTGVNGAAHVGHHVSAMPGKQLIGLLEEHSVLKRARAAGRTATFANAFRPTFFEMLERYGRPRRASASTVATWVSGASIRTLDDLRAGRAVYHDIVRDTLVKGGHEARGIEPAEAAAHLATLVAGHDFTFFEHFLTDLVGHRRVDLAPAALVARLESFVDALTATLDPTRDAILLTSDHGNFEDLSTTAHTRNPVPLLLWGGAHRVLDRAPRDLTDVTPAMLDLLDVNEDAA